MVGAQEPRLGDDRARHLGLLGTARSVQILDQLSHRAVDPIPRLPLQGIRLKPREGFRGNFFFNLHRPQDNGPGLIHDAEIDILGPQSRALQHRFGKSHLILARPLHEHEPPPSMTGTATYLEVYFTFLLSSSKSTPERLPRTTTPLPSWM